MPRHTLTPMIQRFWRKVVITRGACWQWSGALTKTGYGSIGKGRRSDGVAYAHRISYEIHFGSIPAGLEVRHSCDTPSCVNPEHLLLGAHRDNMRDMARRQRADRRRKPRGMAHGNAILTDALVREIRASPDSSHKIAKRLGMSQVNIAAVKRRATWRHVPD